MHASSHEATTEEQLRNDQQDAVAKAMSLIIAGICDPDVIDRCFNEDMRLQLALELVDSFVQLLKGLSCPYIIIIGILLSMC